MERMWATRRKEANEAPGTGRSGRFFGRSREEGAGLVCRANALELETVWGRDRTLITDPPLPHDAPSNFNPTVVTCLTKQRKREAGFVQSWKTWESHGIFKW